MYTCSSPTLVHLSALRCFRWPAMLSFSSSFITFIQSYFVCRFFFFVSPLTHLNFRCLFVCLLSLSWSWWFCPCSFIFVGQSPGAFVTLWTRLGELLLCDHTTEQFGLFFLSLHCGGHSLWSPVFWKLHYTFFPYSERNKGLSFEKLIMNQCTHWKLLFALWLNGKGILHLFINAAFLIFLYNSYTWIWRLTLWLRLVWCWTGLDQDVGRWHGQRSVLKGARHCFNDKFIYWC